MLYLEECLQEYYHGSYIRHISLSIKVPLLLIKDFCECLNLFASVKMKLPIPVMIDTKKMESFLIFNICTSFSFDFFGVPLDSLRAESKDLNLTLQKWLHSFHSIQPQENWTYRERYTSWTIRWSVFPGGKNCIPFQRCYTWRKWTWKVTKKLKHKYTDVQVLKMYWF